MSRLQLSFACALYDRMQPLYTGEVQPDGIELNFIAIDEPRPIFDRMSGGQEFDVAEYSSSEFVQRFANKQCPFVALPVFPSRCFRHGFIAINKKSGIRRPKDLEGKRVGVPLYTMTAAIFIRGLLQHEYGVDLDKIQWVQGAVNHPGAHGDPHVLPLLKSIPIETARGGRSLNDLIVDGVVDATLGTSLPESIRHNPNIARLFPDYVELEKEYYKRTRIYPIMHLIAIRREVYERYPFIATSLYNAFERSKRIALKKMYNLRALRYMTPWLMRDIDEIHDVFDGDPWPYGTEKNRPTLEALVTYLADQHLTAEKVPVDDLFVANYGDTESWF
jgi:4,5-dihydroxyphthalate decarboxylase